MAGADAPAEVVVRGPVVDAPQGFLDLVDELALRVPRELLAGELLTELIAQRYPHLRRALRWCPSCCLSC